MSKTFFFSWGNAVTFGQHLCWKTSVQISWDILTWELRISVQSRLFPPSFLELEHPKDHVPQLSPQEVASSGGGWPGAFQHRLVQHMWMVCAVKHFEPETKPFTPQWSASHSYSTHLVVVPVGDGIGLNSSFLHLKQDPDGQDGLAVLSTQLQQHAVTHLGQETPGRQPQDCALSL